MARRKKMISVSLSCVRALSNVPTETLRQENGPTIERLMQAGVTTAMQMGTRRVQIIGPAGSRPLYADGIVRLSTATLDRLAARGRLDPDPDRNRQLYEAGDKLRTHHQYASLSGLASNDLNRSGGSHPADRTPITETMERHRRSLRLAESTMDPGDWRVMLDVVCLELTLEEAGRKVGYGNDHGAAAVAIDRVRRGLAGLAELWGFSPPSRPAGTTPIAANASSAEAA